MPATAPATSSQAAEVSPWVATLLMAAFVVGAVAATGVFGYARRHARVVLPAMLPRARRHAWSLRATACLGLGLVLLAFLLTAAIQVGWLPRWDTGGPVHPLPLLVQTLTIPFGALLLIVTCRPPGSHPVLRWPNRRELHDGVVLYAASLAVLMPVTFVYGALLRYLDYPLDPQPVVTLLTEGDLPPWCLVYLLILAVVVAPLFEETVFRGILLPVALRGARPLLAMCAISILFAAIHLHLPGLLPLFVLAMIMSAGYLWTGSLWVPIIVHALFNAGNITLLFLMRA